MSSPKARDSNRSAERTTRGAGSRPIWPALLVVSLLVLGAVAFIGVTAWRTFGRDVEPLLAESRTLLEGAADTNSQTLQLQQVRAAEPLLREYLLATGRQQSTAKLFLCACLMMQDNIMQDSPIGQGMVTDELLNEVKPSECATQDLLTAAKLFVHTRRLTQTDWLIGAALQKGDEREPVLRLAAKVRYDLGREDDVLEHCAELARLNPRDPQPWKWMAYVHEDRGYLEPLIEAYSKLVELSPEDADEVWPLLIQTLIETGQAAEARQQFDQWEARSPQLAAKSPLTQAQLLHLEGNAPEALRLAELALQDDPAEPAALMLKGKILLAQSKLEPAIEVFEKLVQIAPTYSNAYYALGQAYARHGDKQQAENYLAQHQRLLTLSVRIHSLERRAGRNPTDADVRLELAQLYEELGNAEVAQRWKHAAESLQNRRQ